MRLQTILEAKDKLVLIDLPYNEKDLEPVIDRDTVRYHYGVLSKGYVDRYNNGEGDPTFNKAGALLHNYFWQNIRPPKDSNVPNNNVNDLIESKFNTFPDFKLEFAKQCATIKGSGWCYLSTSGKIKVIHNHKWENDILLLCDYWEHVSNPYEPRDKFLKNFWKIVNWDFINSHI